MLGFLMRFGFLLKARKIFKPLLAVFSATTVFQGVKKITGGTAFAETAFANPVMQGLMPISAFAFIFVIFYKKITSFFGVTPPNFLDKIIVSSLPLLVITTVGFFGYLHYIKSEDSLHAKISDAKTAEEYNFAKKTQQLNHFAEYKKDSSYLEKAIKNGYQGYVYADMAKDLPPSALNKRNSKDQTPLMQAVFSQNLPAVKALSANKKVDLRARMEYKPLSMKRGFGWLLSKTPLMETHYNAYKIAQYEKHDNIAYEIKKAGQKRGWPDWKTSDEKGESRFQANVK